MNRRSAETPNNIHNNLVWKIPTVGFNVRNSRNTSWLWANGECILIIICVEVYVSWPGRWLDPRGYNGVTSPWRELFAIIVFTFAQRLHWSGVLASHQPLMSGEQLVELLCYSADMASRRPFIYPLFWRSNRSSFTGAGVFQTANWLTQRWFQGRKTEKALPLNFTGLFVWRKYLFYVLTWRTMPFRPSCILITEGDVKLSRHGIVLIFIVTGSACETTLEVGTVRRR
jgi:hypothetical protein